MSTFLRRGSVSLSGTAPPPGSGSGGDADARAPGGYPPGHPMHARAMMAARDAQACVRLVVILFFFVFFFSSTSFALAASELDPLHLSLLSRTLRLAIKKKHRFARARIHIPNPNRLILNQCNFYGEQQQKKKKKKKPAATNPERGAPRPRRRASRPHLVVHRGGVAVRVAAAAVAASRQLPPVRGRALPAEGRQRQARVRPQPVLPRHHHRSRSSAALLRAAAPLTLRTVLPPCRRLRHRTLSCVAPGSYLMG
jgi:hypothetical protein